MMISAQTIYVDKRLYMRVGITGSNDIINVLKIDITLFVQWVTVCR